MRVNLNARPMAAVSTSYFPTPIPQELRHNLLGSDRFTIADLNHTFHQFELDDESKDLFDLFNYLVMGIPNASRE